MPIPYRKNRIMRRWFSIKKREKSFFRSLSALFWRFSWRLLCLRSFFCLAFIFSREERNSTVQEEESVCWNIQKISAVSKKRSATSYWRRKEDRKRKELNSIIFISFFHAAFIKALYKCPCLFFSKRVIFSLEIPNY